MLAEIFRRYGPHYREQFGDRMLPSQRAAMTAIEQCRTEALGGHIYTCSTCATMRYSYHSCRNRHGPTCQQDATQAWLTQQQELLLPVPYFLVTFTLPAELREVARSHQRCIYTLLFRSSAAALQQLAQDPRFLGGQSGMLGVLQTWTRDLRYHPHVHYLVPAIGLSPDGTWVQAKSEFLVHVKPLAQLFRAKFRAAVRQTPLCGQVPPETWRQGWVADCRPVGSGRRALQYLAPYIFRVALSNNRIVALTNDQVTFRYMEGATGQPRTCTLPAEEFIRRFLQHILPKGFVKVRYFGLFSPGRRRTLAHLRHQLALATPATPTLQRGCLVRRGATPERMYVCPTCGQPLQLAQTIPRRSRSPPGPRARIAAPVGHG
jgi:hypothetical protein